MRKNQPQSAITTIYDTDDQALIIDRDVDHFFKGTNYTRKVIPLNGQLWIEDNGTRRTLQSFIWEVWNAFIAPGHTVVLKDPDTRDYRLKNLELAKIPKEKKSA